MSHRLVKALLLYLLSLLLVAGCGGENEDLKRARKLMETKQWANARTALGQVLKASPRDKTARGLLVVCLDNEEGLSSIAEYSMIVIASASTIPALPSWKDLSDSTQRFIEESLVEVRKALFDKGIDTKDNADLAAVMMEAARHEYANSQEPERKEVAAAIVAMGGDKSGISYLIERLKGQKPKLPTRFLAELGTPAIAPLRTAIADKSFLGRKSAQEALALILTAERAHVLLDSHLRLMDPTLSVSRAAGKDRLPSSALPNFRDLALGDVHVQYVALADGKDDGFVVLQAWDDDRAELIIELHALREGRLHQLPAVDSAAIPIAMGTAAIFKLEADRGGVLLHRVRERTFEIEVPAGRVISPKAGLRVHLRQPALIGTLLREDEGLWIVKLDRPLQGLTEVPVAASSLTAMRSEQRTETVHEVLVAQVHELVLRVDSIEVVPAGDEPTDTKR